MRVPLLSLHDLLLSNLLYHSSLALTGEWPLEIFRPDENMKATLLLIVVLATQSESMFVVDVLQGAKIVVSGIWKTWNMVEHRFEAENAPTFHTNYLEKTTMKKITQIMKAVNTLSDRTIEEDSSTIRLIEDIGSKLLYQMHLTEMVQLISNIEIAYESFREYTTPKKGTNDEIQVERHTLESFASFAISSHPSSVFMSARRMSNLVNGSDFSRMMHRKGFFEKLHEFFKKGYNTLRCERDQSVQQMLFNMYGIIQMAQLKAYAMAQFSWMLLKIYEKGNFTMESEMFRQQYIVRMEQQATIAIKEMKSASNEHLKCDPIIHKEDETYTELTRFLQGYVVNEVDLNGDNTCKEDCAFYQYTTQKTCFKDQFCARQPKCRGNIVGCNFVDSDMWICQAPGNSMRRYDWIEYENGRTLGSRKSCSRGVTKVDSWWRWLFWHCSYCFCFCDDPSDHRSHRYFNMRSVTSDIENNKVVVGMRFIKVNKVIHLQIQEGDLIPNGNINATTVKWRPVDSYEIGDQRFTAGVDYHMLTWEHRAIDLDDLIAPEGYVLTGVRFRRVGGHLNFEIQITKMDFQNGTLIDGGKKSMWISNDNTDGAVEKPRTKVTLKNPDNPIKNAGTTSPDSVSDQFMEFTSSDLDLDAGQTVVPFIDTQIVAPQPPVPLIGAGIYHKGKKYSGGFVAPKVFTFNYSSHILNVFPEVNEAEIEVV